MRTPVNARQANALGQLLSTMPAAFDLDPMGTPGEPGPLLIDFDRLTVRIDEAGVCCLVDAELIGAVS